MTLLLFGTLCFVYFCWYSPSPILATSKVKEIRVGAEDNLQQVLQSVSENTTLLLSPSFRVGEIRMAGKANVTLKGQGKPEEIVLESASGTALWLEDCTGCRLENITLRTKSDKQPAVKVSHGNKITLHRLVLESPNTAVEVHAKSYDFTVSKSKIVGRLVGTDTNRVSLTENLWGHTSVSSPDPVVELRKVCLVSLDHNEMKGVAGVSLTDTTAEKGYQNIVFRNKITATKQGFILENGGDFLITSNEIEVESGPALSLRKCVNIQLGKGELKNLLKATHGKAVELSGSSDIVLNNNWLSNRDAATDPTQAAYTLEIASCKRVQVLYNEITGFASYQEGTHTLQDLKGGGVLVERSSEITLKQNHIFRGLRKGLHIKKQSEVTAQENTLEENEDSGVEIENSQIILGPQNTITKNITGVVFKDSSGVIQENLVLQNRKEGVFLENSSPKVFKNKIAFNGSDGISLQRNSSPEVSSNDFIGNQGHGIAFWQPKTVSWKQNTFRDNQKGDSNK